MSIDPIRPYLPVIGLALVVAILFGGCSWGKSLGAAKAAETIAAKDKALTAAHASLSAAADALRQQEAANTLRVIEAKRAAKLAGQAEGYAKGQEERGDKAADAYAKGLRDARRKPDCNALLNSDVLRVCGL